MNLSKIKKVMVRLMVFAVAFLMGMGIARITRAQDNAKSLLWKLEGNGIEKPSYIYGTIHMICPDDFILTEATKQAVKKTDQVVMELDMDDPQLMTKMQMLSVNEGQKNIKEFMTAEDYEKVDKFFVANYGTGLAQLGILKPFALMSMMIVKQWGCPEPASYESAFVGLAKEQEIEVIGLETPEFQFGIFDKASIEEQISWITYYLDSPEEAQAEIQRMLDTYKASDLEKLYEVTTESPQFAEMEDELLIKRNANWIPKMLEHAKAKPTFFAVGAAHLGANTGVLELLRKEGYTVTPVM